VRVPGDGLHRTKAWWNPMVKLALFTVFTVPLLIFSWPFLRNWRTHGFYRFFAFEIILLLILSNTDQWFNNPLSLNQVASWIVMTGSLILAIHGFYLLRVIGQPRGDFENTTRLVIVGAYRYIRHPLYGSLLFLVWGIFLKDLSLLGFLFAAIGSVFLFATARIEESENLGRFGDEYAEYMKSTRMFIPYFF
jgi:protein-S-isoprenylcysteine O-methyltransferase Ste14